MTDIATSLITDGEREYLILKNRANTAADDGTYEWALNEIERLRLALREYTCDCENGCQGIRGEVCGNKARAALGEKN